MIHEGYRHLLRDPEQHQRGLFCLSKGWLTAYLRFDKWRAKGAYGDARKLFENWKQQGIDMRDCVAILVYKYKIPEELVINADHTSFLSTSPTPGRDLARAGTLLVRLHQGTTSVQSGGNKAV